MGLLVEGVGRVSLKNQASAVALHLNREGLAYMTEVGYRIMDEVEAMRFGEGVGEDLDVVAVLGGPSAAVMEDALGIGFGIVDEAEIFDF